MLVQVLALDRRFGFAGGAAVLVEVQVLALDGHFGFAGAAAMLMLVLDRRVVLLVLVTRWCRRWLWIDVLFCVMPGMTPCHAQNYIMSRQG